MDESESIEQIYLQRWWNVHEEFFERKHTSEYVGIKEFRKSNICMKF